MNIELTHPGYVGGLLVEDLRVHFSAAAQAINFLDLAGHLLLCNKFRKPQLCNMLNVGNGGKCTRSVAGVSILHVSADIEAGLRLLPTCEFSATLWIRPAANRCGLLLIQLAFLPL